ncbi:mannitol dehydrogenase family protein [Agrobacterium sp. Azo12]|nr:mannitol dehydrogenase family protein [Agrobacterium sp. Azo12]MDO5897798.1 mannitol dehydrogenase family protein [Agrobacterium sp. Azo12]
MTMETLSSSSLLPDNVSQPTYNRKLLKPGIVHIGLGAFHRAHQAVFTQKAIEKTFGPWGIVAVNLRSPEPVKALQQQEGLYSVITRSADGDKADIIGVTVDWICAAERGGDVIAYLSNPDTRIVTLTVSEKAYGLDPVTGGLDLQHPAIKADMANPHAPVGVVGFLVEGLVRRRERGHLPFTILCCDNLPSNGHVVRRLVLEMAEQRDPELARWIEQEGKFPCSMVDRIVPAATAETRQRAISLLGVDDRLAIETEPFMQWIIEDDFISGRPTWEAGGAVFATYVEPYEKMKLRLLNGSHTLIAHLGILHDLEFVRDVMAVPEFVAKVERHMEAVVATLDPVPGIDLPVYRKQLLDRFANPTIAHRTEQIALDTSQKLPQRILSAASETLAAGRDATTFAYVIALWIKSIQKRGDLDDPRGQEILAAAAITDPTDASAPYFAIPGLFPPELVNARSWRDQVNAELAKL